MFLSTNLAPLYAHTHIHAATIITTTTTITTGTPSGIDMLKPKELEEGFYIALCRVLISKMQTVTEPLHDAIIANAFHNGYDTIYSKYNVSACNG